MTADIRKIYMRLSHYDISPKCKKMTESIHCSVCDGDIGIQKKTGICPDICDNWYQMCKQDSIEAIPESERSETTTWLDFGQELKLSEFTEIASSADFCEGMGFKVSEEPFCFNGVPTAEILKLN